MNAQKTVKTAAADLKAHWSVPAEGNYVSYKEIMSLSVGHMGQRLATTFALTQEEFVCNTLGMSQFQRVYMGYATTALSLLKNLLNGYILDNRRSPEGKFRCYIKLGIPAGIILLLSLLFIPFDRLAEYNIWYMILVSYGIDQIQGYISGWFVTGVAGLNQVITPNVTERTKVIAIEGIIHNFAPTITDIAVSMLKEKSFGFYNIRSFRVAYAPFIVIGTLLSLLSFYGTKERMLKPKSHMTNIGFLEAFRQVSHNKIFWIRMFDGWNDFLEGAKGNILKTVYTYGEVAKGVSDVGLKYGLARDAIGSASMLAMAMTPTVVRLMGKGRYKFYKNIVQVFLLFGMGRAYKKHVLWLILFLWLDKIFDTATVIDSSIEADMKDYQHYLSGERIDGAFAVVKLYMNTAIGAVTDLFLPYVKKKYGLTNNYDDLYNESFRNKILDALMKISIFGAVIDCVPYYFYDISENDMDGITRVLKIRTLVEDSENGIAESGVRKDVREAVESALKYAGKVKPELSVKEIRAARKLPKSERKNAVLEEKRKYKEKRYEYNEITIADFVLQELKHYETGYGKAELEQAKIIASGGFMHFADGREGALAVAEQYAATDKESKRERRDLIRNVRAIEKCTRYREKYYPNGITECDGKTLENALSLPENTRDEKKIRAAAIKQAEKERSRYAKACKPYLLARRKIQLAEGYAMMLQKL